VNFSCSPSSRAGKRGQTVIEYVVSTVIFMLVVAILSVFLYTLREQNTRVLDLVGWNYP
jgi:type II secretory pathway component PulJ